ncbi:MAG TPA: hypothetical protein VET24_12675 [Actinomycetota bacterium]|nr:hypothetical protein [Actinomycetota bacterium]
MAVHVATAVQDEVLEIIDTVEDATLKVLKDWTKTLETAPTLSEFYFGPKFHFYGFAEKLWASQKEFMVSLLELATEAGKHVPDPYKKTPAAAK